MRYSKRMDGSRCFTICGDPLYFAPEIIRQQGTKRKEVEGKEGREGEEPSKRKVKVEKEKWKEKKWMEMKQNGRKGSVGKGREASVAMAVESLGEKQRRHLQDGYLNSRAELSSAIHLKLCHLHLPMI